MSVRTQDLSDGIRKIDLAGRLDVEGATAIDLQLTVLTAADQMFSIIDLADVEFLASIGVGMLIRCAKSARLRQGNIVLLNPRPNVAKVLATCRVDQVIPVSYDLTEAIDLVRRPASHLL